MYFIHGTQGYKYPIFVHRSNTERENKTEEKHNHKNKINYFIIIIHFYPEQSNTCLLDLGHVTGGRTEKVKTLTL